MLVFLAMLAHLLFSAPERRPLWVAAVCFLGVTLLLTLTRSVWIASLAGLLAAAWSRFPTLKTVLVSGAGILVLAACLPDSLQQRLASIWDPAHPSNAARLEIWKTGVQMVKANPWVGVGPQRVSKVFFDYHPDEGARQRGGFFWIHMHNNLLQFAAERGVPCALAWLWLILRMGRDHWRGFRRARLPSLEKSVHATGFLSLLGLFRGRAVRVQFRGLRGIDGLPVPGFGALCPGSDHAGCGRKPRTGQGRLRIVGGEKKEKSTKGQEEPRRDTKRNGLRKGSGGACRPRRSIPVSVHWSECYCTIRAEG